MHNKVLKTNEILLAIQTEILLLFLNRTIKGYLHDKICVLVTHQIQFLQHATKIIVLNHVSQEA